MDTELRALFVEIRTKDWEHELDTFRYDLQIEKINKKRFSLELIKKHNRLFIPILIGLVLGSFISVETSLILYVLELVALCIGIGSLKHRYSFLFSAVVAAIGGSILVNCMYSVLAMSTFSILFRSAIGGGVGVLVSLGMLTRFNLDLREVFPFLNKFELKSESPLEPHELLRFWESNMGVYLDKKQVDLTERLKNVSDKKEEINQLLLELTQYDKTKDLTVKKRLEQGLKRNQHTENDLVNIIETLDIMKKGFLHKISKLKVLIEERELLEENLEKRQTLHLRISQALESNEGETSTWELEKKEMQIELRSIMDVFRDQILQSGDFFQAQMDLVEYKGNQIDE